MRFSLGRRLLAEFLGTAFLVAAVVGSGIMAERLAGGNVGLALLANTIATAAALAALILALRPISGAHLNPVVSLSEAWQGGMEWKETVLYIISQICGGITGTICANVMFALAPVSISHHARHGASQWFSEFVATFGLLLIIRNCAKFAANGLALAVACYIAAAYWFTASTSFANPAVTIARSFSDTFAGIQPADVPGFLVAQVAGGFSAAATSSWLSFRSNDPAGGA